MIDFLSENWKLILEAVVLVASVVLFIVRKKPVNVQYVDNIKSLLLMLLPSLINSAELGNKSFGSNGIYGFCNDKKQFVVTAAITYLTDKVGLSEEEAFKYADFISQSIEDILSTPQKKGDPNGKKN